MECRLFVTVLSVAVNASVFTAFSVSKSEFMNDLLLDRSNASWVLAFNYINQIFRQLEMDLLKQLSVSDSVDCNIRIHISESVAVNRNIAIYLDDVFLAVFCAFNTLNNSYSTVSFVKFEEAVYLEAFACLDMVKYVSCVYSINIHI